MLSLLKKITEYRLTPLQSLFPRPILLPEHSAFSEITLPNGILIPLTFSKMSGSGKDAWERAKATMPPYCDTVKPWSDYERQCTMQFKLIEQEIERRLAKERKAIFDKIEAERVEYGQRVIDAAKKPKQRVSRLYLDTMRDVLIERTRAGETDMAGKTIHDAICKKGGSGAPFDAVTISHARNELQAEPYNLKFKERGYSLIPECLPQVGKRHSGEKGNVAKKPGKTR